MTFLDRLVGFTLALFCAIAALLIFAIALGWHAVPVVTEALYTMNSRAWETALSSIVLLLAALHLMSNSLPRKTERAIVRDTPLGQVRVSLRAIENAVYRSVRGVKGVRECDVNVTPSTAGVDLRVSIIVAPDLVIPNLVDEVQRNVERYVQETVGIPVVSVTVEVKAVSVESKARVE